MFPSKREIDPADLISTSDLLTVGWRERAGGRSEDEQDDHKGLYRACRSCNMRNRNTSIRELGTVRVRIDKLKLCGCGGEREWFAKAHADGQRGRFDLSERA